MTEHIREASTAADFDDFARLVGEYVAWTRGRYRDDASYVDRIFGHQSLAAEIDALSTVYGRPHGRTLLAVRDDEVCGVVAYRRLADGSCEMKRLFVADRHKGLGIGRRLCEALIEAARDDGYALMRLDTGSRLDEAIAMYESLGFRRCRPHHDYPADLMAALVFMEKPLLPQDVALASFARDDRAR